MSSGAKSAATILVYGVSGAGKTTQIGELAKWVWKKSKLKTRLVSASGGGWGVIQHIVDAGIVVPTFVVHRPHAYATISKLGRGYWPADPNDPTSRLLPIDKQSDWDEVGAVAFDSMTEIAANLMRFTIEQEAQGNIKVSGQDPSAKWKDDDMSFGSPSMGMYNSIQNYVEKAVSDSAALVDKYVLWTALEKKARDDNTKLPVYGPDIIGDAKTSVCPAWFNQVLHLVLGGKAGKEVTRTLYLTPHFSEDRVACAAKNTVPRGGGIIMPSVLTGDKLSLGYFMSLVESKTSEAKEQLKKELE